jgi:glycolate oxidase FAD binding subunit
VDLTEFAEEVGESGAVTIAGMATRGGPVEGVTTVMAPAGIEWLKPEEMTVCCGAGTAVNDLDEALASVGQRVAIAPTGTVGGALALGHSSIRRLGHGPIRDTLLQVRYISADGRVITGGGPTVKNVSGFDICRLMVGSRGTLGFIGEVILRTNPRARFEQWYAAAADPARVTPLLYRPVSVLTDGEMTWVLLEGDERDVTAQASGAGLSPADPPALPTTGRWSVPPEDIGSLTGHYVAEVGVGVVHHELPAPERTVDPVVRALTQRIKQHFDPTGRLNPGVDVLG